tara:strand:+ start:383 stop:694 length:312 start_codon:yes stop_codon:yes gene_type:complete
MARVAPQEVKISYDINKVQELMPFNAIIKFHYFVDIEPCEEDITIDSLEDLDEYLCFVKEQIEGTLNNRDNIYQIEYVSLWNIPNWDSEQEIKIQDIWTNENY